MARAASRNLLGQQAAPTMTFPLVASGRRRDACRVACRVLGFRASVLRLQRRPLSATQMRRLADRRPRSTSLARDLRLPAVHDELTIGTKVRSAAAGIGVIPRPVSTAARPSADQAAKGRVTADDLVKRNSTGYGPTSCGSPTSPNTPPRRQGVLRCVIDAFSRRIVGWSIEPARTRPSSSTPSTWPLAAGTAAGGRSSTADRGVQGGFNWSSQHLDCGGVDGQASGMDDRS